MTTSTMRELSGYEMLDAVRRGELPPAPVAVLIGMTLDEIDEGRTVFSIVPGTQHENPMGTMHGGILATLLAPDAGRVERDEGLRVVYFDQGREQLDPAATLREGLGAHGDTVIYRDRPIHVA